jgi:hypothetical protein
LPIEAKSGKIVASDWFDGSKNRRSFAGERTKQGILLYGGNETYSREGVAVTSWLKVKTGLDFQGSIAPQNGTVESKQPGQGFCAL